MEIVVFCPMTSAPEITPSVDVQVVFLQMNTPNYNYFAETWMLFLNAGTHVIPSVSRTETSRERMR